MLRDTCSNTMEKRRVEVEEGQDGKDELYDDNTSDAIHSSLIHATNMLFKSVPYTKVVSKNEFEDKTKGEDIFRTNDLHKSTKLQGKLASRIVMPD